MPLSSQVSKQIATAVPANQGLVSNSGSDYMQHSTQGGVASSYVYTWLDRDPMEVKGLALEQTQQNNDCRLSQDFSNLREQKLSAAVKFEYKGC